MAVSEIQASTWENRSKKPSDLVSDNVPLMWFLRKKGKVVTIPGGRVIWENARYQQNNYVQRIDATQEMVIGYNDTLTAFEYSPKIMIVPVVINELEKAQNQGEARFVSLLIERNQTADDSLINNVEQDLQGDGTGYGGKAFAGIQTYIVTSTSSGSYGGLSRATYSSIRNVAVNAPTTFTGITDSSNIESRLRYVKNQIVRGTDKPTLCLAGQTYFNAAGDSMSAKQRFTQDKETYEAGFDNIVIEGMVMVNAGGKSFSGLSRIADDRAYLINLDNFAFKMYSGYNFQPIAQRTSFNQLVDCSINLGIGQFTCNGSSLSVVMYDS